MTHCGTSNVIITIARLCTELRSSDS